MKLFFKLILIFVEILIFVLVLALLVMLGLKWNYTHEQKNNTFETNKELSLNNVVIK